MQQETDRFIYKVSGESRVTAAAHVFIYKLILGTPKTAKIQSAKFRAVTLPVCRVPSFPIVKERDFLFKEHLSCPEISWSPSGRAVITTYRYKYYLSGEIPGLGNTQSATGYDGEGGSDNRVAVVKVPLCLVVTPSPCDGQCLQWGSAPLCNGQFASVIVLTPCSGQSFSAMLNAPLVMVKTPSVMDSAPSGGQHPLLLVSAPFSWSVSTCDGQCPLL